MALGDLQLNNALGGMLGVREMQNRQALTGLGSIMAAMNQVRAQEEAQRQAQRDAQMDPLRQDLMRAQIEHMQARIADIGRPDAVGGSIGADPMIAKVIAHRDAAKARGDDATAQLYDQYAQRMAAGYNPLQLGQYQGQAFNQAQRNAELQDRGVVGLPTSGPRPVPSVPPQPAAQPSAQPGNTVQFPSSGYTQAPGPVAKALQAEAGTDRDMSKESALRGAAQGIDADISPRDRREVETTRLKELREQDAKRYDEFRAKVPPLATTVRRLEALRNMTANDQTFANAGAQWKMQLTSIGQSLGLNINVDKLAKSESYVAEVAELMKDRLASKDYGSGTGVSNLDLLAASVPLPEIAKSKNGRLTIIDALVKDSREKIDDINAFRSHYEKNKGNMQGFRFPSEALAEQRMSRLEQFGKNPREATGKVRRESTPAGGGIQFLGWETQ